MEPLKPEQKAAILAERPAASPADIEEYERLLAERFTHDPSQPVPAAAPRASFLTFEDRERRLRELHNKLFGPLPTRR